MHAALLELGILAALLFYAYEKRRRGLSDPRLWPIAGFAVAFGVIGSRVLTWDVSRQVSLADRWGNGDRSILAELPGTPTAAAWGITLTPSQTAMLGGPPGVGLHPSFAYEIVFHAAAFALMTWLHCARHPARSCCPLCPLFRDNSWYCSG